MSTSDDHLPPVLVQAPVKDIYLGSMRTLPTVAVQSFIINVNWRELDDLCESLVR